MRLNTFLMYLSLAGIVAFLVVGIGCLITGEWYMVPKALMALGCCIYFFNMFSRRRRNKDVSKD